MKRSETIGYKMRLIHNQIHKTMEAKRKENEGDLTGMQCWLMRYIKDHDGTDVYQRDIEVEFKVSRATASNMLSVMERKGLIRRLSVAHDARLKKLVLTDQARELMERADQDIREMEELIVCGMSDQEIAVLRGSLDRVLANLGVEYETDTRGCALREKSRNLSTDKEM